MFVSHFTKWTWIKIYYRFYYSVYFKHIISKKRKKIAIYAWCFDFFFIPALFSFSSVFEINKFNTLILFLFAFLIILPFIMPLTFLLVYAPKLLVCFQNTPSSEEQGKINKLFEFNTRDDKYNTSLNYGRNVMDNYYDALLDTKNFFLIYKDYKKGLVSDYPIILVINKKENREKLGNNGQDFLDFILPKCKKYIKK